MKTSIKPVRESHPFISSLSCYWLLKAQKQATGKANPAHRQEGLKGVINMSILPEKSKEDFSVGRKDLIQNETIDACQSAVDKAVEKAADVEAIKNTITSCIEPVYAITPDNEINLAQAIAAHIRRCFGKE